VAYTKTTFADLPSTTTPVTAAELNKIGDGIEAAHTVTDAATSAWSSYSPTWGATTTNPTVGNGTVVGASKQAGKTVHYRIVVTFGSTTAVGSGTYTFTLPTAALEPATYLPAGTCTLRDTSAATTRLGVAFYEGSADTVRLQTMDDAAVTHAAPFAWATGDTIAICGTYEAA
jgi:hypothetical protein